MVLEHHEPIYQINPQINAHSPDGSKLLSLYKSRISFQRSRTTFGDRLSGLNMPSAISSIDLESAFSFSTNVEMNSE